MKFDRSRKWRARESKLSRLPAVEIGGAVETRFGRARENRRDQVGDSRYEFRGRNDSRHARSRPRQKGRKEKKGEKRKRDSGVATRRNLRAKCKPGECSGKRQRAIRFVWQFSFVFIAPFRSLDSTLFPSRPPFSFALFYLIISRRCAIVPQFVYLVAYLAVCLSAFPRPVKPIYTNVRESSAEN